MIADVAFVGSTYDEKAGTKNLSHSCAETMLEVVLKWSRLLNRIVFAHKS